MTILGRFRHNHRVFSGEILDNKVHSTIGGKEYAIDEVKVLPPCTPTKLVCVGLNYTDHAKELNQQIPNEPVLFLKPISSVIAERR